MATSMRASAKEKTRDALLAAQTILDDLKSALSLGAIKRRGAFLLEGFSSAAAAPSLRSPLARRHRWASSILGLSRLGAIASGGSFRGPASVGHYLQPIVEGLLQYHVRTNI